MASFTGTVTSTDNAVAQTLRPVSTAYNDRVDTFVSDAAIGTTNLLLQGVEYVAGEITDSARSATIEALTTLEQNTLLNRGALSKEATDSLIKEFGGEKLKGLGPTALRDLRALDIRKKMTLRFGPSRVAQDAIDGAYKQMTGYVSPTMQARIDQRAGERTAATAEVTRIKALVDGARAVGITVPTLPDGRANIGQLEDTLIRLRVAGSSLQQIAAYNAGNGGENGGGGTLRLPGRLAELKTSLYHLAVLQTQTAFHGYTKAEGAEDQAAHAKFIWQQMNRFKQAALSGQLPGMEGAATAFGTFNRRERHYAFSDAEAFFDDQLESLGLDRKTFNAASIDETFNKAVQSSLKTTEAMITSQALESDLGRQLYLAKDLGGEMVAKLILDKVNKIKALHAQIGKQSAGESHARITKTLRELNENVESDLPLDPATVILNNTVLQTGDSKDPATLDSYERTAKAAISLSDELLSTADNQNLVKSKMLSPKNAEYLAALQKKDPISAAEIYNYYRRLARTGITNDITEIVEDMNPDDRKNLSVDASGKLVYSGSSSSITAMKDKMNQTITSYGRFKGIVPDNALLDEGMTAATLLQAMERAGDSRIGGRVPSGEGDKGTTAPAGVPAVDPLATPSSGEVSSKEDVKEDEEGFLSKVASALNPISSAQAAAPTAEDFASLEAAKGEAGTAEDVVASGGLVQRGDKGGEVQQIQEALGVDTSDGGVGIFGPRTEKAVMEFQEAHGLVKDGKVGPATLAKIHEQRPSTDPSFNPDKGFWNKVGEFFDISQPGEEPEKIFVEPPEVTPGKPLPKAVIPKKDRKKIVDTIVQDMVAGTGEAAKQGLYTLVGDHAITAMRVMRISLMERFGFKIPKYLNRPITNGELSAPVYNAIKLAALNSITPSIVDAFNDKYHLKGSKRIPLGQTNYLRDFSKIAAGLVWGNLRPDSDLGIGKKVLKSFFDPGASASFTIGESSGVRVTKEGDLVLENDEWNFPEIENTSDAWLILQDLFADKTGLFGVRKKENRIKIYFNFGPVEEVRAFAAAFRAEQARNKSQVASARGKLEGETKAIDLASAAPTPSS